MGSVRHLQSFRPQLPEAVVRFNWKVKRFSVVCSIAGILDSITKRNEEKTVQSKNDLFYLHQTSFLVQKSRKTKVAKRKKDDLHIKHGGWC